MATLSLRAPRRNVRLALMLLGAVFALAWPCQLRADDGAASAQEIAAAAEKLTLAEAEARLRQVYDLARDKNDRRMAVRLDLALGEVKDQIEAKDRVGAEKAIRAFEVGVGLDAGGWSMGGLKIFHPTPELTKGLEGLQAELDAALVKADPASVRDVVGRIAAAMGPQAGLPSARQKGAKAEVSPRTVDDVLGVFLGALEGEKDQFKEILAGKVKPDSPPRKYAELAKACCALRPEVEKRKPEWLQDLDQLVAGACDVIVSLQEKDGFFRFPDVRGKQLRYGEMIEKMVRANPAAVKDGWVVVPEPGGGSQFDAGECGTALLVAGALFKKDAWTQAGIRAADWALAQHCAPNWNYNAFSVTLLARAFGTTQDARYLKGAVQKFLVGVAPGQLETGRWVDPHNARTVYHTILLRAALDLWAALPAGDKDAGGLTAAELGAARTAAATVAERGVKVLLDEFESLGVTNLSLPLQNLLAFDALAKAGGMTVDGRLRKILELTAAVEYQKSAQSGRPRFGAAATEVAALARVWPAK